MKECTQTHGAGLIACTVCLMLVLLMGSDKVHWMNVFQMLLKAHWVLLNDGRRDTAVIDKGVRVRETVSLAGRCLWLPSMSPLFFQQIATMLHSSCDLGADQGSRIKRGRRQVFAVMSEHISLHGLRFGHGLCTETPLRTVECVFKTCLFCSFLFLNFTFNGLL